jgi:hypothetical protein
MPYHYKNVQHTMTGGKKTIRKVEIKANRGTKSVCHIKKGKKCFEKTKRLSNQELQLIRLGKFIPGLFNDITTSPGKTRKNRQMS